MKLFLLLLLVSCIQNTKTENLPEGEIIASPRGIDVYKIIDGDNICYFSNYGSPTLSCVKK